LGERKNYSGDGSDWNFGEGLIREDQRLQPRCRRRRQWGRLEKAGHRQSDQKVV